MKYGYVEQPVECWLTTPALSTDGCQQVSRYNDFISHFEAMVFALWISCVCTDTLFPQIPIRIQSRIHGITVEHRTPQLNRSHVNSRGQMFVCVLFTGRRCVRRPGDGSEGVRGRGGSVCRQQHRSGPSKASEVLHATQTDY